MSSSEQVENKIPLDILLSNASNQKFEEFKALEWPNIEKRVRDALKNGECKVTGCWLKTDAPHRYSCPSFSFHQLAQMEAFLKKQGFPYVFLDHLDWILAW